MARADCDICDEFWDEELLECCPECIEYDCDNDHEDA